MSSHIAHIWVKNPQMTIENLLERLNLSNLKPIKNFSLDGIGDCYYDLFLSIINGNLLIVNNTWAWDFFKFPHSEFVQQFIATFPNHEIAVLIENGTANVFAYLLIQNGKIIRVKEVGEATYKDIGDLLEEEVDSIKRKKEDLELRQEYEEAGLTLDEIAEKIEFDAGYAVPNLLSKRYLGNYLGVLDTNLIALTQYHDIKNIKFYALHLWFTLSKWLSIK